MKTLLTALLLIAATSLFSQDLPNAISPKNESIPIPKDGGTSIFYKARPDYELTTKMVFNIAPSTDIEFRTKDGSLGFNKDGSLYLNGELIATDPKLYDFARQLTEWLAPMIMDYYQKK